MGDEQGLVQASGLPCSGGVLEKDDAAFTSLRERWQQQGILLIFSDDVSISLSFNLFLSNKHDLSHRQRSQLKHLDAELTQALKLKNKPERCIRSTANPCDAPASREVHRDDLPGRLANQYDSHKLLMIHALEKKKPSLLPPDRVTYCAALHSQKSVLGTGWCFRMDPLFPAHILEDPDLRKLLNDSSMLNLSFLPSNWFNNGTGDSFLPLSIKITIVVVYSIVCIVGLVGNCSVMYVIVSSLGMPASVHEVHAPGMNLRGVTGETLAEIFSLSAKVLWDVDSRTLPVSVEGCDPWITKKIDCLIKLPSPVDYWDPVFGICVFLFSFMIPVLIITICYSLMIRRLKNVRVLSGSKEKDRNLRRITRMVLVVVAVFIICWTPIQIFVLVQCLGAKAESELELAISCFCTALGYANSSLNPVLYAFLDENFKACFKKFCFPTAFRTELQMSNRMCSIAKDVAYACKNSEGTNNPA
ncbi:nociceptin receptor [Limosa lapponica baueri]|uniref:Nociceptin receptor n=1 Tax=Limosa lapponica baueri TaxID=1758121 RepID=A0A2I0TQA3_LIMLA|nr:nociceptin receptor [Limosa lapponica baueri]